MLKRPVALLLAIAGVALVGCAGDPPAAVVGLVVRACDPGEEVGSGAVVGSGLVLTSAHVVAGATSIDVVAGHRTRRATIVAFDPEMDLAYLSIDPLPVTPLPIAADRVEQGDHGVAYVVRDGAPVVVPVAVRRRVQIRTEDIYLEGETLRPGIELEADIRAGDSGGAVVVDGELVGVIWARSRKHDARAYAIDPVRGDSLVREQLRSGDLGDDIDLTRC